jgi:hypothetical protein
MHAAAHLVCSRTVARHFVRRRSIALVLGTAVWSISFATIAARSSYRLAVDGDSVGVFATLIVAMLGCVLGAFLRERRSNRGEARLQVAPGQTTTTHIPRVRWLARGALTI